EVDAVLGFAFLVAVDVGAADEPAGEARDRARVPLEKAADVVAEAAVPLLPGIADEAADLIETGRVPGFGDQLRSGEQRIGLDVPEDWRARQRIAGLVARQDRRQVEAEAVDMHL